MFKRVEFLQSTKALSWKIQKELGQGGPDLPSSEGGGGEKAGGDEDGGADEGGEEGAVDGLSLGTRLGEKRPMPWSVKMKSN